MTALYARELNLYKFSSLTLGVLILVVSAAGALGLVWMRQQITETAERTVQLEKEIIVVERESTRLAAQIARAHQPERLLARASAELQPTHPGRVVWMPVSGSFPQNFIAEARRDEPAGHSDTPLAISFDLALMNARAPNE